MNSKHTEPGTGTQIYHYAIAEGDTAPRTAMTINGKRWKCGRQYWDTKRHELVELVEIIGKSRWCDTRDPENCPPKLVFVRNPDHNDSTRFMVDPNDPSGESVNRFEERR